MAQRPIRKKLLRRPGALVADESGATLVEFGLFFPILALMVLGAIDLGRGLASRFELEQATQRTVELANLGTQLLGDYSHLRTEAANAAGIPVAQVTLDQWLECRTTAGAIRREASFNGACQSGEQSARYVRITAWRDYVPNFAWIPIIGRIGTGANGAIRLNAEAGVRVQ